MKLFNYTILLLFSQSCFADDSAFRQSVMDNIQNAITYGHESQDISLAHEKDLDSIALYGNNSEEYKEINCASVEGFSIFSRSKNMGHLVIAVCPYESELKRKNIRQMKTHLDNVLKPIRSLSRLSQQEKIEMGLEFKRKELNDGSTMYYFPIIYTDNGLDIVKTSVFFPADNKYSLIVQYTPEKSCDDNASNSLCGSSQNSIIDIAMNLMPQIRNSGI